MILTNETYYACLNNIYVYLFVFTRRTLDCSQVSDSAFLAGKERSLRPLGPPGGQDGHCSAQRGQCPGVPLLSSAPFCDRKDTVADQCWLDGDFGVFWISSSCLFLQVSFAIILFIVKKHITKFAIFITSLPFSPVQFIVILSIFPGLWSRASELFILLNWNSVSVSLQPSLTSSPILIQRGMFKPVWLTTAEDLGLQWRADSLQPVRLILHLRWELGEMELKKVKQFPNAGLMNQHGRGDGAAGSLWGGCGRMSQTPSRGPCFLEGPGAWLHEVFAKERKAGQASESVQGSGAELNLCLSCQICLMLVRRGDCFPAG